MQPGDTVLVSNFEGDLATIGTKAIFVANSGSGKFLVQILQADKHLSGFSEWRYCKPFPDSQTTGK